jgi:hypothetical protein
MTESETITLEDTITEPVEEEVQKQNVVEKEKIKDMLRTTAIELALESTGHGINKIFRSKTTEFKLMWSFLVIAAATACIYIIYMGVAKFLLFNVVTTITDISESPTEFPTVSICYFKFLFILFCTYFLFINYTIKYCFY